LVSTVVAHEALDAVEQLLVAGRVAVDVELIAEVNSSKSSTIE
jgi:hypothetical protein